MKLDALWDAHSPDAFLALVRDDRAADEARFLAAEIVFQRTGVRPALDAALLGEVYARALEANHPAYANPWGLPDKIGPLGIHVLALGEDAAPAFAKRMDETPILYGGSEEASIGASFAHRVKDMAALLVSRLLIQPYRVFRAPEERDGEIERLKGLKRWYRTSA